MSAASNHFECVVVGLGAIGSASLCRLARRGVNVLGIERFPLFHNRGSSHGRSRVFRTTYHQPHYVELSVEALDLWRCLEDETSESLLRLVGLLVFASETNTRFAETVATLQRMQLPHETMTGREASRRFDVFSFDDRIRTFFATQNGMLLADRALRAMHQIAQKHGASVWDQTLVRELKPTAHGITLTTDRGVVTADQVVLSAGPWLSSLLRDMNLPLSVTRERKVHFQMDNEARYDASRLPVFVEYDTAIYGLPRHNGVGLKVAADHVGESVDPDEVNRTVEPDYIEQIASWVTRWMPQSAPRATEAAVCLYTNTPDLDFILDRHPQQQNIVVAGGFSGHGFKFSILIGDIVADLVIAGATTRAIDRFGLRRFDAQTSEA